jgi:hypothetical protein
VETVQAWPTLHLCMELEQGLHVKKPIDPMHACMPWLMTKLAPHQLWVRVNHSSTAELTRLADCLMLVREEHTNN